MVRQGPISMTSVPPSHLDARNCLELRSEGKLKVASPHLVASMTPTALGPLMSDLIWRRLSMSLAQTTSMTRGLTHSKLANLIGPSKEMLIAV